MGIPTFPWRVDARATARRLLRNSLRDINFAYAGLTSQEKALVTQEEFAALVDWLSLPDGIDL